MPQKTPFLLTAAARTLKLKDVYKMGEQKAWEQFVAIRFANNNGEAYCPACGCVEPYFITTRRKWKYLHQYATHSAWIEDNRRKDNKALWEKLTGAAMAAPVSRNWAGYWQRGRA